MVGVNDELRRIWKEAGMVDYKVWYFRCQTWGRILRVAIPNTQ